MNYKLAVVLLLCFITQISSFCQTKKNFDLINQLIDSTVLAIQSHLNENSKIKINFNQSPDYSVFENYITSKLNKYVIPDSGATNNFNLLNYSIKEIKTEYVNTFRKNLLGSFYTERKITLSGDYLLSGDNIYKAFNYTLVDTIEVNELTQLENRNYPFTRSEIPEDNFFTSAWEPILAITVSAATVIMFFVIRSK